MKSSSPSYRRYRFPPQIISHAVWLYHRFSLSFRDVEDLLAQRGIEVSYESVRRWCEKFGPEYAARARRRQPQLGDTWYLDEVFVKIGGRQQYLWRAVDQDGDVLDILVQARRDRRAAERFLRKLMKGQGREPRRLVTDKLGSYRAAHRVVMPSVVTTQASTRTIEPRSHISRLGRENARCAASNLKARPNVSYRFTASFRIYFVSAVIFCARRTRGCFARERSRLGRR